jgi:transcription elongation factor Elf1
MRLFKKMFKSRLPPEPERVYDLSDLPRAAGFGNTVFVDDTDLFRAQRTEIGPLPTKWTCQYCNCVNPPGNVHCEHCGAPHTEKNAPQPSQADVYAQVHNIENLMFRILALNRRLGLDAKDADEFEPDEDGQSVILG